MPEKRAHFDDADPFSPPFGRGDWYLFRYRNAPESISLHLKAHGNLPRAGWCREGTPWRFQKSSDGGYYAPIRQKKRIVRKSSP